jgi:hypothetical protein
MSSVTTEAQVCNLALGLLGQKQFIDRLDERTPEAQLCRVFFVPTWKHLLSTYDWSFARKDAALALTTQTRIGWEFAYAMPSDCIEPRRLWNGERRPGRGGTIPWARGAADADSAPLVLTDQEEAVLIYTANIATVARWPASFVTAVAAQLAVPIAGGLSVKPHLIPGFEQAAQRRLLEACAIDLAAQQLDEEAEAEHIRERG